MANKNTYGEFIIVSIDYIRLFGKNNYIELHRKMVTNAINNTDILDIDIPIEGHEYITFLFINTSTSEKSYCTHISQNKSLSLTQSTIHFSKALKRLLKIHKLNNDKIK